ncbi:MAG TPA: hypothetical protein VFF81_12075 [Noviherbaspirillum sp.]|nr:hypothetical protein [Noviherbaspirillum sp.]
MQHLSSLAAAGLLSLAALPVASLSQTFTIQMTGVVTDIYGAVNYQLGDQFVITLTGDAVPYAQHYDELLYLFTGASLTLPRDWGVINNTIFDAGARVNDNDNVANAYDTIRFNFGNRDPLLFTTVRLTDDQGLALSNESIPMSLDLSAFEFNQFYVEHRSSGPWGETCPSAGLCAAQGRITSYSVTAPDARPGNPPTTVPGRPGFTPGRPTTTPPPTPPGRPR